MYRPWGCCCLCAPVKEGTVALAFVNLILGFLGAVITLVMLVQGEALHAIDKIERLEDCDDECHNKLPFWGAVSAVTNVVSSVALFLCALPFVFGVIAFKSRPCLLVPYLVWLVISAPLELPDLIFAYYTLKSLEVNDAVNIATILVALIVSILVRTHFFVVVRQFQKQEMEGENAEDAGVRVHPSSEEMETQPSSQSGFLLNHPNHSSAPNQADSVLYFGDHPPPVRNDPPSYNSVYKAARANLPKE